ncbi:MarR family winged helix-turn-helix transcriptional regulator [Nocardiopsis sp. CC223A]|uniref:MarR family winged helix-turn-helix transcriptional regulator n=1 Tax=Nocardiopsis sp. CC223A TaxID=3044051 RepID=UPI00278BCA17|nr:MarR family transcriptional regulator [Nocardiopsis sp. CC223A]
MSTTDPAPADVRDFGHELGVLVRGYHAAVDEAIGDLPHGPRGYRILSAAVDGEPLSQLALATRLGIDRTVMTYVVDDLTAADLVERRPNPRDRRQRHIVATDHGTRTLRELRTRVVTAEEPLLAGLEPGERQVFRELLHRVAAGLEPVTGDTDGPC